MRSVQEDDSLLGGNPRRNKVILYVGLGLFILWNILLFILAVVAIAKADERSDKSSGSYSYAPISRTFTVGVGEELYEEAVVSLTANGNIRLGAGVTAYVDQGPLNVIAGNSSDLISITFNPDTGIVSLMKSELILIAYTNHKTGTAWAKLGVISLDTGTISKWGEAQEIKELKEADALCPLVTGGLNKKSFALAGTGTLVIGHIYDEPNLKFNYEVADTTFGSQDVKNVQFARLSANSFAVTYDTVITLLPIAFLMNTSAAVVQFDTEGKFKSISWSEPYKYGADRPYHTVFRLSDTSYGIAYPSTSAQILNSTSEGNATLIVQMIVVNNGQLTPGPPETMHGVKPNYYLTSVGLTNPASGSPAKAVVVLVDEAQNNALTGVLILVPLNEGDATPLNALRFGDIIRFTSDAVGDDLWQRQGDRVIPFVSVTALSDHDLAIAYSDFTNNGRITTLGFTIDEDSLRFIITTPAFVISEMVPDLTLDYWWICINRLVIDNTEGWVVLEYLQRSNMLLDNNVNQTVVEMARAPFGVVPMGSTVKNNQVPVVVSGVYKSKAASFTPGRYYYSDTRGRFIQRVGSAPSVGYVKADQTLVSLSSRIGVAISTDELLLINTVPT